LGKSFVLILTENVLGYTLAIFSQAHLVTLVINFSRDDA
jgi:hypothetical protein